MLPPHDVSFHSVGDKYTRTATLPRWRSSTQPQYGGFAQTSPIDEDVPRIGYDVFLAPGPRNAERRFRSSCGVNCDPMFVFHRSPLVLGGDNDDAMFLFQGQTVACMPAHHDNVAVRDSSGGVASCRDAGVENEG